LIGRTTQNLATVCPSWTDALRLFDATPVPCGRSRETVKRSALAGLAGYGSCASHSRWYWGLKLYLLATPEGMPVAWCLADPKIGEREVAQELLAQAREQQAPRTGMIVLTDKGLAGRDMERYAEQPMERTVELEVLPAAQRYGLGFLPGGPSRPEPGRVRRQSGPGCPGHEERSA
jgi:hypothetical protein